MGAKTFPASFPRHAISRGRTSAARRPRVPATETWTSRLQYVLAQIRINCGTRIIPCGGMPLGTAAQKEHAPKRRNCPAGTAYRGASDASDGCAFQARSVLAASPKRAPRRAWVPFVPPLRGSALPCAFPRASRRDYCNFFMDTFKFAKIRVDSWLRTFSSAVLGGAGGAFSGVSEKMALHAPG